MEDTKTWWESKIIWAQIISIVFVAGSKFDWWPKTLDQTEVLTAVVVGINIVTMVFRSKATTQIGPRDKSVG